MSDETRKPLDVKRILKFIPLGLYVIVMGSITAPFFGGLVFVISRHYGYVLEPFLPEPVTHEGVRLMQFCVGIVAMILLAVVLRSFVGEWFLRLTSRLWFPNSKEKAVVPLFAKVYAKAQAQYPKLPKGIRLLRQRSFWDELFCHTLGMRTVYVSSAFITDPDITDEEREGQFALALGNLYYRTTAWDLPMMILCFVVAMFGLLIAIVLLFLSAMIAEFIHRGSWHVTVDKTTRKYDRHGRQIDSDFTFDDGFMSKAIIWLYKILSSGVIRLGRWCLAFALEERVDRAYDFAESLGYRDAIVQWDSHVQEPGEPEVARVETDIEVEARYHS